MLLYRPSVGVSVHAWCTSEYPELRSTFRPLEQPVQNGVPDNVAHNSRPPLQTSGRVFIQLTAKLHNTYSLVTFWLSHYCLPGRTPVGEEFLTQRWSDISTLGLLLGV